MGEDFLEDIARRLNTPRKERIITNYRYREGEYWSKHKCYELPLSFETTKLAVGFLYRNPVYVIMDRYMVVCPGDNGKMAIFTYMVNKYVTNVKRIVAIGDYELIHREATERGVQIIVLHKDYCEDFQKHTSKTSNPYLCYERESSTLGNLYCFCITPEAQREATKKLGLDKGSTPRTPDEESD